MIDIRHAGGCTVETGIGDVRVQQCIGKGKSGYSYLAQCAGEDVVIKFMHDEPCAYYDFGRCNKVAVEKQAFEKLTNIGICTPALLYDDCARHFLVKEYVPGTVADKMIASGKIIGFHFQELFIMHHALKDNDFNIDYFPANFVIMDKTVFYIDYEVNSYSEEWNLENWGIYYWLNKQGMQQFLKTRDARFINENVNSGIPIKAPFYEQVEKLKERYGKIF